MEKTTLWVWRAVDGVSRQALGWVLGDRTDQKLVQQVDTHTWYFITDEWGGFFCILPENRHFWGKDLTFPIEGTNSDIRHRLARFKRKKSFFNKLRHAEQVYIALSLLSE